MPMVLSLRTRTSIPLEVDSLRLETLRGQTADEVRATLVQYGNKQLPAGEFFDVSGSAADDETLVFEGDCSQVKLIGTGLTRGRIVVEGNAGMHLGAEMHGGEIRVEGNAGDWVGAEMHGGTIHVRGSAGHLVGAVYRGGRKGMTAGEIVIDGDAGNEIGHTMRRGTIVVLGNAGDAAGFGMLAGTILIGGSCGIRPGAGMRRGSIVLLGEGAPPPLLPTFVAGGVDAPVYLRFYLRELSRRGAAIPPGALEAEYRRHRGDFVELGRGEILVRCSA